MIDKIRNNYKHYGRRVGVVAGIVPLVLLVTQQASWATTSFTFPTSPTGGGMGSLGNGVIAWVTGTGIPVFFGLIALAIVLRLVVKLVKRGAKAIG